jgi:uncharacterized protein
MRVPESSTNDTSQVSGQGPRWSDRFVAAVEDFVFEWRLLILAILALVTIASLLLAERIEIKSGYEKQLPLRHEYIETLNKFRGDLTGSNRVIVVVEARDGNIWTVEGLRRIHDVTKELSFLEGIDRRRVTSVWTPNARYLQVLEDGLKAEDLIGGDVTVGTLDEKAIQRIRSNVVSGGYLGTLISNDQAAAMVTADVVTINPRDGKPANPLVIARGLQTELREKYEDDKYVIRIIGQPKLLGTIADEMTGIAAFIGLAFLLTGLAVYSYCRSWSLTVVALLSSLSSVAWQFAAITLLGYDLDPLAVLVPFLIFAIGVSHGVQQINAICRAVSAGQTAEEASRASFRTLLLPGAMALVTSFISFAVLTAVPVPMIHEIGVTAAIGIAFKIVTNLFMLPLIASTLNFNSGYARRIAYVRSGPGFMVRALARLATLKHAKVIVLALVLTFVAGLWFSQGRQIGDVQAGAPELRETSRYNVDATQIASRFDLGLDILTVVIEADKEACLEPKVIDYVDRFAWYMEGSPGVLSVNSPGAQVRVTNIGWNEGNPRWDAIPDQKSLLVQAVNSIASPAEVMNERCDAMFVSIYASDHRSETVDKIVSRVNEFARANPSDVAKIRLGAGNVGVIAATNDLVREAEWPMLLAVYACIVLVVAASYRSIRAVICCCVPLTVATVLGYVFMKYYGIGLKVATLPVMVLAAGIGVDYAFYIFSKVRELTLEGVKSDVVYGRALVEVGNATIFTAITLAAGVATWSLSPLKFQADMGVLLTFMFLVNLIMAVIAVPALAIVLDHLFPAKKSKGVTA